MGPVAVHRRTGNGVIHRGPAAAHLRSVPDPTLVTMTFTPAHLVTRITASTPEDLLAAVPLMLGFVPCRSVVMLTFDAERAFHARVDLPTSAEEVADVVGALLGPARRHRVRRVVFVVYATDPVPARQVAAALAEHFAASGIDVLDALRADGSHWFPLLRGHPGVATGGVPYDVSHHPFAVASVLDGRVTHRSREELAASLRSDPALVDRVAAEVARLPAGPWSGLAEEERVRSLVRRHVRAGGLPGDPAIARLLVSLTDDSLRDAAWLLMSRANAREHVSFWTLIVRCAPGRLAGPPATLLSFAAWLSGQGALAWCALDRCEEADPGYRLAGQVALLLERAVPPDIWDDPGAPAVS